MQISVHSLLNKEHPYYSLNSLEIYLDGVRQEYVYEVDTLGTLNNPKGWIKRYKRDDSGNAVILNGEVAEEKVYGNVEIKVKDNIPTIHQ